MPVDVVMTWKGHTRSQTLIGKGGGLRAVFDLFHAVGDVSPLSKQYLIQCVLDRTGQVERSGLDIQVDDVLLLRLRTHDVSLALMHLSCNDALPVGGKVAMKESLTHWAGVSLKEPSVSTPSEH